MLQPDGIFVKVQLIIFYWLSECFLNGSTLHHTHPTSWEVRGSRLAIDSGISYFNDLQFINSGCMIGRMSGVTR